MKSSFSFTAKIWKWPGMGPASSAGTWHFVHLPREYFEPIRAKYGKGMVKVSLEQKGANWVGSKGRSGKVKVIMAEFID
jgi:hypothetical protein